MVLASLDPSNVINSSFGLREKVGGARGMPAGRPAPCACAG
jgi:hypothetical protein